MIWPETELTGPDPMLDELRAIRDEIGAYTATLSDSDFVQWYRNEADDCVKQIGYRLVPHPTLPDFRFGESHLIPWRAVLPRPSVQPWRPRPSKRCPRT